MPLLFDAHCHLQALAADGAGSAIARARASGVARMACCATGEADWAAVQALAGAHPEVVPLFGLHPWKAAGARPGWEARLEDLLALSPAGLGECGLDFSRRTADREAQVAALRLQLRLAGRLDRPVALHCVRAWGPLLGLLREAGVPSAGAMVHAFSGSAETARELQDLGLFLSFTRPGPALGAVREDRLLVESDGDPSELPRRIADLATARGVSAAALGEAARRNAERLFGRTRP